MTDPVLTEIGEVVALGQAGDAAAARRRFGELWDRIDDPFHRCALAHYAADVQDDPADELRWDLQAMAAADAVGDRLAVRGFYPSLHLNLAADHVKVGDLDSARHHLALAEAAAPDLPSGGYGEMITGGIARLRRELDGSGHNREAASGSGT
jgi:hypothetical protein